MAFNKMFLNRAVQLAEEHMTTGDGGPFGAVVAKDERIVAEGWNRVTSSNDPTAHAEVEAIRSACRVLNSFSLAGCELYASCEPCPMCLGAIYWARIDRLYFAASRTDAADAGFDDEQLYRELALPVPERAIPMEQHLTAEALCVFDQWKQKEDKTLY